MDRRNFLKGIFATSLAGVPALSEATFLTETQNLSVETESTGYLGVLKMNYFDLKVGVSIPLRLERCVSQNGTLQYSFGRYDVIKASSISVEMKHGVSSNEFVVVNGDTFLASWNFDMRLPIHNGEIPIATAYDLASRYMDLLLDLRKLAST